MACRNYMEFTNKVQDQFRLAGWNPSKNTAAIYGDMISDFPPILKSFLLSYGNTIVNDASDYEPDVNNTLEIKPERTFILSKDEDGYDYLFPILGYELYAFAYFTPDEYYIASDFEGNIYMLGDYIFRIAGTLQEGIERLILDDWSNGYEELDDNNWKKVKKA